MLRYVYVPKHAPPKGYTCQLCQRKLKFDDLALFFTDKGTSLRRGFHKTCIVELLNSEPETIQDFGSVDVEYARIKQAALDGNPWA